MSALPHLPDDPRLPDASSLSSPDSSAPSSSAAQKEEESSQSLAAGHAKEEKKEEEVTTPVGIPPNSISLRCIPDFLTPLECAHLITLADGRGYHRSLVGNNGDAHISSSRTSNSCSVMYAQDATIQAIRTRAARLTGHPESHVEIDLLRYTSGQEFKPHYDSRPSSHSKRQFTIFAYLNDLPSGCGGETHFTRLGFKMTPKCGAALFWENMPTETMLHADARHAGLPPKEGYTKYGINIFIQFHPLWS